MGRDLECGLRCLRNDRCQSYNCFAADSLGTKMCHLSKETRKSRPEDFKKNQGSTYFELMQVCFMYSHNVNLKYQSRNIFKTFTPASQRLNCQEQVCCFLLRLLRLATESIWFRALWYHAWHTAHNGVSLIACLFLPGCQLEFCLWKRRKMEVTSKSLHV